MALVFIFFPTWKPEVWKCFHVIAEFLWAAPLGGLYLVPKVAGELPLALTNTYKGNQTHAICSKESASAEWNGRSIVNRETRVH